MKKLILSGLVLVAILAALPAFAAPLKVFVGRTSASGVANREELQQSLQVLLGSRLSGDNLTPAASAEEADILVNCSYIVFGKVFSLDAVAATTAGRVVGRAFVQGDSQEELIPAVSTLARKLEQALAKVKAEEVAVAPAYKPVVSKPVSQVVVPGRKQPVEAAAAASGEIVKVTENIKERTGSWRSQPLDGVQNLLAAGRQRADGSREIFVADNRHVGYYRQGKDLKLLASVQLELYEKLVALDTLDVAEDGVELYLTVMGNEALASRVYLARNGKLQLLAGKVPYYFRTMALAGGPKKLYVQKTSGETAFSGEVFEAALQDGKVAVKGVVKLPPATAIYRFAQFADKSGAAKTVVLGTDDRLKVYDNDQRELWRSIETYSGSELFMEKREGTTRVANQEDQPKIVLPLRLQATGNGEVLVGKNETSLFGIKKWNFNKGKVYCFGWNGETLETKWHTRDAEYYMPDYYYDEATKELLQLELIERPMPLVAKGSSVVSIKKTE